ncbi:MAG: glycerate kinase, partial [Chloroflexi bacterium]|nr:glycerate kinase [Chloroflexota bacterium]
GRTAVIEMAQASGLVLVPEGKRDLRLTSSYGTGELIGAALDEGCREIIVGLGGSATNDGGAGMAQALGASLTDASGAELPHGGAALGRLEHIDLSNLDPRLKETRVLAATDVTNPLCGPEGASAVYGPQKGATPDMVMELDAALERYASVVRQDLGIEVLSLSGAGAAGGMGAGLVAVLGAEIVSGAALVCDTVGLDDHMAGAGLVITGEGLLDGQTVYNKAPMEVARRAIARGVPVIMVAGALGPGHEAVLEQGVTMVEAAAPDHMPLDEALSRAYELVRDAAERAVRRWYGQNDPATPTGGS